VMLKAAGLGVLAWCRDCASARIKIAADFYAWRKEAHHKSKVDNFSKRARILRQITLADSCRKKEEDGLNKRLRYRLKRCRIRKLLGMSI